MSAPQILATGRCLPSRTVTNEDMCRMVETTDEWIFTRTGIRSRDYCQGERGADLAEGAARQALERSGLSPEDIGVCLVSTFTPDFATPSTACQLQKRLGLREDTICFDLNAACAGFLYGMRTAHALLADSPRPYALLVGVLIALTALIPIVGAFIGCAVGALLIAIDDPWKALWFIVLFLVLQQIEGNLIYPHVVGSSVGLPSIWVLAAVTLGGKLMGITGMLFFIPLCSVIYALFRSYVKNRLVSKAVPPEKWRDPPPPPSRQ